MEKYLAVGLIRIFDIFTQEALTAQFDSFKVQFSLLERKNTENEAKIADHEAKIREQADEINQFKAKFDTKQDSAQNFLGSYNDENILPSDYTKKMNSIHDEKENAFIATSSTRAIAPASCRELALIGHSLDGLYLVKNPDTNKIETVLCNFGTSSKYLNHYYYFINRKLLACKLTIFNCYLLQLQRN